MKDEKVVNVQHATNAQLLEEAHQGSKQFGADAGGLGHTEADCAPLEAAAVRWMAEPAIFPLGRVEAQRQIAIGQVDQHPVVILLNALSDGLQSVHLERDLDLEIVQRAVVCAEPEFAVLLRDHEDRRFKVAERTPCRVPFVLRAPAVGVVIPRVDLRRKHGDPLFLRPRSPGQGKSLPEWGLGKQSLVPVVGGGRLDGMADVLETVNLLARGLQGPSV
jgi:hypothetical protein